MIQFSNLLYNNWLTKLINCLEKILYKWSNFCLNRFSRTTKYLFCLCLFCHIFSLPAFPISCNLWEKFPWWYLYIAFPLTWWFLLCLSLCPFIFLLEISSPLLQTFSGPLHRALSPFVPCIPMLSSAVKLLFQHLHLLQIFFSLRDFPPCIISKKKGTCLPPALVAQKENSTSGFSFPHLTHWMLQFGANFYAEEADTGF